MKQSKLYRTNLFFVRKDDSFTFKHMDEKTQVVIIYSNKQQGGLCKICVLFPQGV
jgi:S-adenosylmethionine synthetase